MQYLKSLILFLFVLFCLGAEAIESNVKVVQLPGGRKLEGLTVGAINVDSKGRTWIGTEKGLLLSDGYHILSLPLKDEESRILIHNLCPKDENNMLVGTDKGLFQIYVNEDYLSKQILPNVIKKVNDIDIDSHQAIAVATPTGVYLLNPDGELADSIRLYNEFNKILLPLSLRYRGETLFIGTSEGLYSYNLKDKTYDALRGKVGKINDMLDLGNSMLLASASQGLWRYNYSTKEFERISIECNVITSLLKNSRGDVYVGTDGDGVFKYSVETGELKKYLDNTAAYGNMPNNQVYCLALGPKGQLFVGLYRGGAAYSVNNSMVFQPYSVPNGFDTSQMSVRAIASIGDQLAIGTRNGVYLFTRDGNKITQLGKAQLRSNLVLSLSNYDSKLFIGTYGGGLSVYDPSAGKMVNLYNSSASLANNGSVFAMDKDIDGFLWIGASDGLYKVSGTQVVDYIPLAETGEGENNIMEVYFDKLGRGWICTQQGIGLLDKFKRTIDFESFPAGFINRDDVRSVYETYNGNLLFVTNQGDVKCFTSQLEDTQLNKLLKQIPPVRGVKQDNKGHLWIATISGLFCINLDDQNMYLYNEADGLNSSLLNMCEPLLDDKGRLWLGSGAGLLSINTNNNIESDLAGQILRPIVVTVNGKEELLSLQSKEKSKYELKLPRNIGNVKLMFSDFAYSGFRNDRYEYSLNEGNTWTQMPEDFELALNLKEGNNKLLIRQRGNSSAQTSVSIYNPYAYAKMIIVFSAVIIILLIIALLYMIRRHYLRIKESEPMQAEEQEIDELGEDNADDVANERKKYVTNSLSEDECKRLTEELNKLLEKEKLYVNTDLNVNELAQKLGVTSHKLSYLFSQYLHTGYYDYIYQYRLAEFKRLAKEDKKGKYTLTALSEKAGFNSRATFFRIFKKSEGITPGDYLRQLRGID